MRRWLTGAVALALVVLVPANANGQDPTGAGPFSIKPLVAAVTAGASPGASLPLRRDLSTVPEAIALF
jgi:hypothetical protein